MDMILNIDEAAKALYGESTRSNRLTLNRQCRDGIIHNCEKVGSRWYINATREWPGLFPQASKKEPERTPVPVICADTTLRELSLVFAATATS